MIRISSRPGCLYECTNQSRRIELTAPALPVIANDALEASKIAAALTESFRRGVPIYFDVHGEAIMS